MERYSNRECSTRSVPRDRLEIYRSTPLPANVPVSAGLKEEDSEDDENDSCALTSVSFEVVGVSWIDGYK